LATELGVDDDVVAADMSIALTAPLVFPQDIEKVVVVFIPTSTEYLP
jgi:hypothetical protein